MGWEPAEVTTISITEMAKIGNPAQLISSLLP